MDASSLNEIFFGNTVYEYLVALGIFVICLILVFIFKWLILRQLEKRAYATETSFDDLMVRIVRKGLVPVLFYGAFYMAVQGLTLPLSLAKLIDVLGVIALSVIGIMTTAEILEWAVETFWIRKDDQEQRLRSFRGLVYIMKAVIWIGGILFMLSNLGFNVTTVLTGMGIGGVAIALASQAILGDLFNYFTILFDRPFEVGDFIVIDNHWGEIKRIGIRSTRIDLLRGEELVVSNTDLTNSRVQNFKKMQKRRNVFQIGVTYQTKKEHLKEIPTIIREIIENMELTEFGRSHFSGYGDFSLNFETAYYVTSQDYDEFMDVQQEVYLKIYDAFKEKGISFAYPTQTLFVNKTNENS